MSLQIELGLFTSDFMDCHAILGVPVDTNPQDIRKHYLKIARRLHPDSSALTNARDRQRASEYLAKLINPAYELLADEKRATEHRIILKLKGEQVLKQQATVLLVSSAAARLAGVIKDFDQVYQLTLKELAEKQYQQIDRVLELTGHISELNLIYLMQKAKQGNVPLLKPPSNVQKQTVPPPPTSVPTSSSTSEEKLVQAALWRVSELEKKLAFPKAVLELREILKLYPHNSLCHSTLGTIYLKLKQPKMAKIHFRKALQSDPTNLIASNEMRKLEQSA